MTAQTRRVAVFTGTRAEYGLLTPVLRQLEQSETIDLSLIVAGAHLSLLHGMTIEAIVEDGFAIDARIEMLLASDTATAVTKSIGLALIDLAARFEQLQPDILVVLGDRYEVLAAAVAALVANIPIAHIHGGELTEGAIDDSIRHAITKLSHLHFVATPDFARRVAQMGEDPSRIHVVGAPAVDVIATLSPIARTDLESELGISLAEPSIVLAYHPSTIPGEDPLLATREILAAVDAIDAGSVFASLPNADPQFSAIRREILEFAEQRTNATAVPSIGHERYLSLIRYADLVIGNSSSGIIEAPVLGTPAINVGQRQHGRPMADCILSVPPDRSAILAAARRALQPDFQSRPGLYTSPYDRGVTVASAIVQTIETTDTASLSRKRFVDRP